MTVEVDFKDRWGTDENHFSVAPGAVQVFHRDPQRKLVGLTVRCNEKDDGGSITLWDNSFGLTADGGWELNKRAGITMTKDIKNFGSNDVVVDRVVVAEIRHITTL